MEALKLVSSEPRSIDLDEVNARLAGASAEETIAWAAETFGDALVMSSSFGAHSALMLHLATRVVPNIPVIFLDTGYLFPETYQFAEELRERFDLRLEVYNPRMTAARQEALFGRLWDGDEEDLRRYLQINKIEPMQRALRELGAKAWIAGLRAEQTEYRAGLRKVELQDGVYKIHPILDWTKDDVERYMDEHDLPYHPLYAWGYKSIGDVHSTVPVEPGEDDRAGRRLGEKRECGIHLPSPDAEASRKSSGL
ncbi:MAG TPA: phosphoadenylyl-sulfate reductase [Sandaracinaceae bacterium]